MQIDIQGKRILIFGDSHSHRGATAGPDAVDVTETSTTRATSPGDLFGSWLLVGAASVRLNAKVGRSAWNLFSRENGGAILDREAARRPDIVFVILGTNDIGLNVELDAKRMAQIRVAFVEAGARVICVGPPMFPPKKTTRSGLNLNVGAERVVAMERRVFGDGFIDARPMTEDIVTKAQGRAGDGIHFNPKTGARKWARRLAAEIGIVVPGEASRREPLSERARIVLAVSAIAALGATAAILAGTAAR